jgi:hypothetical protein
LRTVAPFALCVALVGATLGARAQTNGLVAAYNFDGSTATTLTDVSGNGRHGTLTNSPSWSAGRYRSALQFTPFDDGNDDNDPRVVLGSSVNIPDPPFTVSAWVNPADFGDWRAIFSKRDGVLVSEARFDIGLTPGSGQVYVYTGNAVSFSYAPPIDTWTHLALVAEPSGTHLYVNGVLQETATVLALGTNPSANAAIGGSGEAAGGDNDPFSGRIDDLRIYGRALTQAEIQADMDTPLSSGGTGGDTVSPSAPGGLTASAASGTQVNLTWTAATDNVGVAGYRVERCQGAAGATALADTGRIASTTYRYRVLAVDAAGNLGAYSNVASATTPSLPSGAGLVAAYNFDAGVGTTLPDVSGNGHQGTLLNNPVWTTGRYGSALQFSALDDGNDDNDPRVTLGAGITFPIRPSRSRRGFIPPTTRTIARFSASGTAPGHRQRASIWACTASPVRSTCTTAPASPCPMRRRSASGLILHWLPILPACACMSTACCRRRAAGTRWAQTARQTPPSAAAESRRRATTIRSAARSTTCASTTARCRKPRSPQT